MPDAAPWKRLSPRARRAILLTSFVPPLVLVFVLTPAYLLYVEDPSDLHFLLLLAAAVGLCAVGIALVAWLRGILRKEPTPPKPAKLAIRQAAKFGAALLVFGAIYVLAIYAVVFGLWPLHQSSETGAIALNLVLLAVMLGLLIAFYFGLKALGFKDRWTI